MSTNHTEHYNLSQWLPDDKVLRTDFNEDNRIIDAALAAQAAALDKKADASTVSSQAAELAKKANASELASLSTKITQRNCRVVTQSYTGNSEKTKTLSFTGKPWVVHIMGMYHHLCAINPSPKGGCVYVDGGNSAHQVNTAWSGNSLTITHTDASFMCNWKDQTYYVLAVIEAS